MKETKFRGINTKGAWVYGSLINNCIGIRNKPSTNTKTWIVEEAFGNGGWFNVMKRQYVKPKTVSQYTGLKDKNGVEIYESDVLYDSNRRDKTKVIFYEGCFLTESDEYGRGFISPLEDFEVVGNIYENQELLENE